MLFAAENLSTTEETLMSCCRGGEVLQRSKGRDRDWEAIKEVIGNRVEVTEKQTWDQRQRIHDMSTVVALTSKNQTE